MAHAAELLIPLMIEGFELGRTAYGEFHDLDPSFRFGQSHRSQRYWLCFNSPQLWHFSLSILEIRFLVSSIIISIRGNFGAICFILVSLPCCPNGERRYQYQLGRLWHPNLGAGSGRIVLDRGRRIGARSCRRFRLAFYCARA